MLPDFGWSELLVIAIVLIVIVGPKDLPAMLRTFGKTTAGLRKMAGDFRKQFDEALKEAELDDVRQLANDVRGLDPRNQFKGALNPLGKLGEDLNSDLKKAAKEIDEATKPTSATDSALAASGDKMKAAQAKTGKPKAAAKKSAGAKTAAAMAKAPAKKAATAKTAAKPAAAKTGTKPAAAKTAAAKPAAAKNAAEPAASKSTTTGAAAKKPAAAKAKAPAKKAATAKTAAAKTAKSSGDKS